ncbi:hypothetical protein NIIDMKKI_51850 [Mycobacterium kansasii]|uniref:Neuraminidase-like domain-containing protein n=1 Tax=Mycobacterium kansasii TaxID=1768 RepID=A0A7G1IJJ6_MYCKA|nr:hypothetical protein NIIDMKKI_51850 [Mycobacterium kansasii]
MWSAWERIDLDITGEHVVPVVYNRALHLFWLVITDKPQKVRRQPAAQQTASTSDAPEPPKQLEIKLAWAVRREDGWSPRRVTPNPLVHPWQRPAGSYTLKPRYKTRENQLWLDLYVSTSLEFNNTKFYDPYTGQFAYLTGTRFDETARPWHSSSFVFDGNVIATKLKPLRGQYHVLDAAGLASRPSPRRRRISTSTTPPTIAAAWCCRSPAVMRSRREWPCPRACISRPTAWSTTPTR